MICRWRVFFRLQLNLRVPSFDTAAGSLHRNGTIALPNGCLDGLERPPPGEPAGARATGDSHPFLFNLEELTVLNLARLLTNKTQNGTLRVLFLKAPRRGPIYFPSIGPS